MRITDVEGFHVRVPVRALADGGIAPYRGSQDAEGVSLAQSLLVAVRTDAGVTGWGEMNTGFGVALDRSIVSAWLRPALVGADPTNPAAALSRLKQPYWPHMGRHALASAAEMAMWDILGRTLGVPISTLLGGRHMDAVPLAFCLGITTTDVAVETAVRIREAGWPVLKTKIGLDVGQDADRIAAIVDATAGRLRLRLDANQSYDRSSALRLVSALAGLPIEYIEQPLPVGDVDGMRALVAKSPVPVAINEDAYLPGGVMRTITSASADVAVVDVEAAGGIAATLDIAGAAAESRLPLAHHCGWDLGIKAAVMLQIVSARSAFSLASDSTYTEHLDDVLLQRIEVGEGCMRVPTGAGIGVDVDEDAVRRLALSPDA